MDIRKLRRGMASIEDGRWIAASHVPGLGDMRVKVRGMTAKVPRDMLDALQRGGMDSGKAVEKLISEYCLMEIEGLSDGAEAMSADDIRSMLTDPAMEPLALLILHAVTVVDGTREADEVAVEKNAGPVAVATDARGNSGKKQGGTGQARGSSATVSDAA